MLGAVNLMIWPLLACQAESDVDGDGYAVEAGDCDDANPDAYPGAPEIPFDGVDQNCDLVEANIAFETMPTSQRGTHVGGPRLAASLGDVVKAALVFGNEGFNESAWSVVRYNDETRTAAGRTYEVLSIGGGPAVQFNPAMDLTDRPGLDALMAISVVTDAGTALTALLQAFSDDSWDWNVIGSASASTFSRVGVHSEGDQIAAVGCSEDPDLNGVWLRGSLETLAASESELGLLEFPLRQCAVQGDRVRGIDPQGQVGEYVFEVFRFYQDRAWPGAYRDLAWEGGMFALASESGVRLEFGERVVQIPTGQPVERIRLDVSPDGVAFVVVASAEGDLSLILGSLAPGSTFVEVPLGRGLALDDLDVEATATSLYVAARTADDVQIMAVPRPD